MKVVHIAEKHGAVRAGYGREAWRSRCGAVGSERDGAVAARSPPRLAKTSTRAALLQTLRRVPSAAITSSNTKNARGETQTRCLKHKRGGGRKAPTTNTRALKHFQNSRQAARHSTRAWRKRHGVTIPPTFITSITLGKLVINSKLGMTKCSV